MNVGFNTYLIQNHMASTIHLLEAKCEEENGQITYHNTGYCYENLCSLQYNKPSSRK
jgi:hypothetical protein